MPSDVLFFNAIVANDTGLISAAVNEEDMNIDSSFSNSFNAAILDKASDYDLAICRLAIPSDTIDLLNITSSNVNDYQIGFTLDSKTNITDSSLQRKIYLNSLPMSTGSYSNTPNVYPYSYHSSSDVVEAINRTLFRSYYNSMFNMARYIQSESNYGYHVAGNVVSFDTSVASTITIPSYTPNALETRVCSVVLQLNVSLSSGNDPFSIILGNSNNECLVVSTSPNQPEYNELKNNFVLFAEYGIVGFNKNPNMNTTLPDTYYPAESFLTFSNAGSGGSWYISIVNTNNSTTSTRLTGTLTYNLEVIELANVPSQPPVFGINNSNKLELLYQQQYVVNNMKIAVSPKLYRMLAFTGSTKRFSNDFNVYELLWPNLPLVHPLYNSIGNNTGQKTTNGYNTLIFNQFSSTIYRLNNVTNIMVGAQSLGVVSEFYNDYYQQQIISDFIVNTENDMGELIFTTDASIMPYRRYRLQSDTPLTQMGFNIFVKYRNGSVVKLTLPPGTHFAMKIGFFKRNAN